MEFTLLQTRTPLLNKQIRLFNEYTDLIPIRKLIHKAIEIYYPAYYEDEAIRFYKEYHHNENILMRARNGYTVVCTIHNKIIGTGSLIHNKIDAMCADPAFQGKGIGKRIMYVLLQEAKRQGLSRLTIEATPGSKKFYEIFGFKSVREEIVDIDTIHVLNYFIMEKTL